MIERRWETIEELRNMPYEQYLNSKWWRFWGRKNRQKKCQLCNFRYELNTHHLTYDNLGDEKECDLITLCKRCHQDGHYYEGCIEPTKKMVAKQGQVTEKEYQTAKENWQG